MLQLLPVHLALSFCPTTRWLARAALVLAFVLGTQAAALAQQSAVTGRVVDAELGEPLVGAVVELTTGGGSAVGQATTSEDGTFRIAGVPPGRYNLIISTLGYELRRIERISVGTEVFNAGTLELTSTAFRLNPIVVTASREQEKALESPSAVYTVTAEEVGEKTSPVPVDNVVGLPGVDNVTTGLQQHNVVARGLNNVFSGALFVLSDYRWASVPSLRFNAYNLIPTTNDDIERIEFVLGPGSALYGPNVDKGVMHIITRSPLDHQGTTVSLAGGLRGPDDILDENDGVFQGTVRHAGLFSENVGYKISAMYFQGKDWTYIDPVEEFNRQAAIDAGADSDTLRVGSRDFDAQRVLADARVDWRLNDNTTWIFSGGLVNMLSSIEMTGIGTAQADEWTYYYFQTRFRAGNLFTQFYYNKSNAGDSYLLRDGRTMVDKSSLWAAQLQHTSPLGDRQRFVYGADVISTNPDTEGTIHGRNETTDNLWEAGVYGQSETTLSPKWDLVLAARVDWHNKVEDIVFSPRAAIVFKPTPEHNLRVAYNRAFSQPTSINLSLDLLSSPTLGPWTDYGVRALGVPHETGLTFNRSCTGGLCVRSPFNPAGASEWLGLNELDESAYWNAAIDQLIAATGPLAPGLEPLLRSLDPSGQLGGVLRTVDLEASPVPFGQIEPVNQAAIDVAPLVPSITNTIELGYKGLLTDKLLVGFDVYWQRVEDFIGPLNFETPNAFYDPRDMAVFLAPLQGLMQPADFTALVVGLSGMPLATATWNEASDPTDTYLTYRNFGNVDLWGVDLGLTLLLGDKWTVSGAYSLNCGWVSSDSTCVNFFPNLAGIDDVALNAPNNKGMASVAWRNPRMGLGVEVRGRYVEGYPVSSGVFEGDIPWFMPFDVNIAYTLPIATATDLTLTATNVFSCSGDTTEVEGGCGFRNLHQEMIGAPFLGRMVLLRLRQNI